MATGQAGWPESLSEPLSPRPGSSHVQRLREDDGSELFVTEAGQTTERPWHVSMTSCCDSTSCLTIQPSGTTARVSIAAKARQNISRARKAVDRYKLAKPGLATEHVEMRTGRNSA